mgnify:CR=1 FL=1
MVSPHDQLNETVLGNVRDLALGGGLGAATQSFVMAADTMPQETLSTYPTLEEEQRLVELTGQPVITGADAALIAAEEERKRNLANQQQFVQRLQTTTPQQVSAEYAQALDPSKAVQLGLKTDYRIGEPTVGGFGPTSYQGSVPLREKRVSQVLSVMKKNNLPETPDMFRAVGFYLARGHVNTPEEILGFMVEHGVPEGLAQQAVFDAYAMENNVGYINSTMRIGGAIRDGLVATQQKHDVDPAGYVDIDKLPASARATQAERAVESGLGEHRLGAFSPAGTPTFVSYALAAEVNKVRSSLSEPQKHALAAFDLTIYDAAFLTDKWKNTGLTWGNLQTIGEGLERVSLGGAGVVDQDLLVTKRAELLSAQLLPPSPLTTQGVEAVAGQPRVLDFQILDKARQPIPRGWLVYQYMRFRNVASPQDVPVGGDRAVMEEGPIKALLNVYQNGTDTEKRVFGKRFLNKILLPNATGSSAAGRTEDLKAALKRVVEANHIVPESRWDGITYMTTAGMPVLPVPDEVYNFARQLGGSRKRLDPSVYSNLMTSTDRKKVLSAMNTFQERVQAVAPLVLQGEQSRPAVKYIQALGLEEKIAEMEAAGYPKETIDNVRKRIESLTKIDADDIGYFTNQGDLHRLYSASPETRILLGNHHEGALFNDAVTLAHWGKTNIPKLNNAIQKLREKEFGALSVADTAASDVGHLVTAGAAFVWGAAIDVVELGVGAVATTANTIDFILRQGIGLVPGVDTPEEGPLQHIWDTLMPESLETDFGTYSEQVFLGYDTDTGLPYQGPDYWHTRFGHTGGPGRPTGFTTVGSLLDFGEHLLSYTGPDGNNIMREMMEEHPVALVSEAMMFTKGGRAVLHKAGFTNPVFTKAGVRIVKSVGGGLIFAVDGSVGNMVRARRRVKASEKPGAVEVKEVAEFAEMKGLAEKMTEEQVVGMQDTFLGALTTRAQKNNAVGRLFRTILSRDKFLGPKMEVFINSSNVGLRATITLYHDWFGGAVKSLKEAGYTKKQIDKGMELVHRELTKAQFERGKDGPTILNDVHVRVPKQGAKGGFVDVRMLDYIESMKKLESKTAVDAIFEGVWDGTLGDRIGDYTVEMPLRVGKLFDELAIEGAPDPVVAFTLIDLGLVKKVGDGHIFTGPLKDLIENRERVKVRDSAGVEVTKLVKGKEDLGATLTRMPAYDVANWMQSLRNLWESNTKRDGTSSPIYINGEITIGPGGQVVAPKAETLRPKRRAKNYNEYLKEELGAGRKALTEELWLEQQKKEIAAENKRIKEREDRGVPVDDIEAVAVMELEGMDARGFSNTGGIKKVFATTHEKYAYETARRLNETLKPDKGTFTVVETIIETVDRRTKDNKVRETSVYTIENPATGRSLEAGWLKKESKISIEDIQELVTGEKPGTPEFTKALRKLTPKEGAYDLRQNAFARTFFEAGKSAEALKNAWQLEYLSRLEADTALSRIRRTLAFKHLDRGDMIAARAVLIKEFGEKYVREVEKVAQNGVFSVMHRSLGMMSPEALLSFKRYIEKGELPARSQMAEVFKEAWADAGLWNKKMDKPTVFGSAAGLLYMDYSRQWYGTLFGRAIMDHAPMLGGKAGRFWNMQHMIQKGLPAEMVEILEPTVNNIKTRIAHRFARHAAAGGYDAAGGGLYNMLVHWQEVWTGTYADMVRGNFDVLGGDTPSFAVLERKTKAQSWEQMQQRAVERMSETDVASGEMAPYPVNINFYAAAAMTESYLNFRLAQTELVSRMADMGVVRVGLPTGKGVGAPGELFDQYVPLDIQLSGDIPNYASRSVFMKYGVDYNAKTGAPVDASTRLYIQRGPAEMLGVYRKLADNWKQDAASGRGIHDTSPMWRLIAGDTAEVLSGTLGKTGAATGKFWRDVKTQGVSEALVDRAITALDPAFMATAKAIEFSAGASDAFMKSKLIRRSKINMLFRAATGGIARNAYFSMGVVAAMHPDLIRSRAYWNGIGEYYRQHIRGKLMEGKGTDAGEFARFAKQHNLIQEFALREAGIETGLLKNTALESLVGDTFKRVHEQTADVRKSRLEAERKLEKKKKIPSERRTAEIDAEIVRLDRLVKELNHAEAMPLVSEFARSTPNFIEAILGSQGLDKVEGLREWLVKRLAEDPIEWTEKNVLGKFGQKRILSDMAEFFTTGGSEIRGRWTRTMAALFVAGDDAPRYAMARALWSKAVKKHGSYDLPMDVQLKIAKAAQEALPDYNRNSALMKASRLQNMWNYFPWKMTRIALKFAKDNPHAAALYIFLGQQMEDHGDQEFGDSWAEFMMGRDGYGNVMSTPWGSMKSDFFKFTPDIAGVYDMVKNSPIANLIKIVTPISQALVGDKDFREAYLESVAEYTRHTAGASMIPFETALVNGLDSFVHPTSKNQWGFGAGLKAAISDGGRHVDMWNAVASGHKYKKHNVDMLDAMTQTFLGVEKVENRIEDRIEDLRSLERTKKRPKSISNRYKRLARRAKQKELDGERLSQVEVARLETAENEVLESTTEDGGLTAMVDWLRSRGHHRSTHFKKFRRKIIQRLDAIRNSPEVMQKLESQGIVLPTTEELFPEGTDTEAEQMPLGIQ